MKFCALPCARAAGGILAHSVAAGKRKFKKGKPLSAADCAALAAAGVAEVTVAMPEKGDLLEDDAAAQVAAAFTGAHLRHGKAVTGRVNIFAAKDGLLMYDTARIHTLNSVSAQITAATLPPATRVRSGEMLATIKIIPFAVRESLVRRAAQAPVPFAVHPFVRKKIGLIHTTHSASSEKLVEKTRQVTSARLAAYGAHIAAEAQAPHTTAPLCAAIREMCAAHAPDALLIAGAQAVSDEADTVPAAIRAAGGVLHRVGMPVDPGNLLLLAQLGDVPVVGMPGCAKSPKLNGLDWVLARILADAPPTAVEIAQWGVGGLLAETGERPAPRQPPRRAPRRARITALLLAAGAARRMGGENKLLRRWRGQPLVAHSAHTIAAAVRQGIVQDAIAVTGRDGDEVAAHLPPQLRRAHNPQYEQGLGTSLACGLRAVQGACDAVLICLADMPRVQVEDIRAVCAAAPDDAEIVVPVHHGKRGNPVLLRKTIFPRLLQLQGDEGARALFSEARVTRAEAGPGVLVDLDTPAGFAEDG